MTREFGLGHDSLICVQGVGHGWPSALLQVGTTALQRTSATSSTFHPHSSLSGTYSPTTQPLPVATCCYSLLP